MSNNKEGFVDIKNKDIEMGKDLNKYGKRINVKKELEEDDDGEEPQLTLKGTFIIAVSSMVVFFIVFFLSGVIIKLSLFNIDGDNEEYENEHLPCTSNKPPYKIRQVMDIHDEVRSQYEKDLAASGKEFSEEKLKEKLKEELKGVNGCQNSANVCPIGCIGSSDSNNNMKKTIQSFMSGDKSWFRTDNLGIYPCDTHGIQDSIRNLYSNGIYCFRKLLNYLFRFIFSMITTDGQINWKTNYLFTLIVIPILVYISPIVLFPLASLCSFIGILMAGVSKYSNSHITNPPDDPGRLLRSVYSFLYGLLLIVIYLFIFLPIFVVPISFLMIFNLVLVILYSWAVPLDDPPDFVFNEIPFSVYENFSQYFPYNLFISVIIFAIPFISYFRSPNVKIKNTLPLSNMIAIISILSISLATFIIAFVIKKLSDSNNI